MKARPNSQAGRILALLETGGWWSCAELMREVPSIVHSRMDNVRKHLREEGLGRTIEHKTTGVGAAHSLYRIVGYNGVEQIRDRDVAPMVGGSQEDLPTMDGAVPLPAEEGTPAAERPLSQQLSFSALTPEEDKPHMYRRAS